MWLIFAILSLLTYAATDLFGKKKMNKQSETGAIEMLISFEILALILSIALFALVFGESGKTPWRIIIENPLILFCHISSFMYWMLFLVSMHYVGLSMEEAVSGAFGVFYFVGIIVVNLFTGKLATVSKMLYPIRLILIIIVVVFVLLLPNVEVISQRHSKKELKKTKVERRKIIIGLLIMVLAIAFDSADSIVATIIFDEKKVEPIDFFIASQFSNILTLIISVIYVRVKSEKSYFPFKKRIKETFAFAFFLLLSVSFYMISSSLDAVRTGIIFLSYPVVPIIGAKILLKEKYTFRQNICIWVITIGSICFCITDYLL